MNETIGTISIVSHGHGRLVGHLLQDLAEQEAIGDWLVILTLNVEEEVAIDEPTGLRMTIVRNDAPKGFGANHNAAADRATGELFVIVNPDIRLPMTDTLARLVAGWEGGDVAVLAAPTVVAPDGEREDSVRRNLSPTNLLARARRPSRGWEADPASGEFFWLAGMFLMAPLATFRALGGFDERYRLYCEDYDLSARWCLAGGEVRVVREIEVVHDARRDSHRSMRHMRWHVASLLRVWMSRPFWAVVARRAGQARSR